MEELADIHHQWQLTQKQKQLFSATD